MNPSVPDRIGSAVRALSYVVLPSLPQEASLAREQTQLVIGHLQIILAQYDATPQFEAAEAKSFVDLARAVTEVAQGGPETMRACDALRAVLADAAALRPLLCTKTVQEALDRLLSAIAVDGDAAPNATIRGLVLDQGAVRADIDRRWFSLMGFDPEIAGRMKEAS